MKTHYLIKRYTPAGLEEILAKDHLFYLATNNARYFDSVQDAKTYWNINWYRFKSKAHIVGPRGGFYAIK